MLARLECESLLDLNFGLPRAVQGSPAPHSCQQETHRIAASYPDHEDRDDDQDRDDLEHQDDHEDRDEDQNRDDLKHCDDHNDGDDN